MKRISKWMILLLCVFLAAWAAANAAAGTVLSEKGGKEYLIEINRISQDLSDGENTDGYDLSSYNYVKRLSYLPADAPSGQIAAFFNGSSSLAGMNYPVKPLFEGEAIQGYIRYEYAASSLTAYNYVFVIINAVFAAAFVFSIWFFYISKQKFCSRSTTCRIFPWNCQKAASKRVSKKTGAGSSGVSSGDLTCFASRLRLRKEKN